MRLLILSTAAAMALASAPAFAQQQPQAQESGVLQACGADIQTFCSGVQPGEGRIAHCLRPHLRQLSPECKGQVVEAHAKHKQMEQQQQQQPYNPQP
jgi:hypothetical protein